MVTLTEREKAHIADSLLETVLRDAARRRGVRRLVTGEVLAADRPLSAVDSEIAEQIARATA